MDLEIIKDMTSLSIIAVVGNNRELGLKNQLLCHLPEDLKRFKTITSGHTVIMGDKTWESLPKKPLPNRRNIVMTLHQDCDYPDCEIAHSIEELYALIENEEECFIIGGATIYNLFINTINKLYLTRVLADFEADAFFPEIDFSKWELKEDLFFGKDERNRYDMRFQYYELKK
jgi:dihydrofolate reductase